MVSARSVVQLLAPVIKFLFFAGPGRAGAGGTVDARLYAHVVCRTPGAVNMGGGRTAKGCCGPHVLAVLRMADLHGRGEQV